MRRRLLIVLLALGTLGGYASGFASLARHRHRCHAGGWGERRDSRWESEGPRGAWGHGAPRGDAPASMPATSAVPTESAASPAGPR